MDRERSVASDWLADINATDISDDFSVPFDALDALLAEIRDDMLAEGYSAADIATRVDAIVDGFDDLLQ